MALKLTVLTAQREELGSQSSIVFGVGGGRIGRANDNDWILPDPERWLSAHHARIQFRDGAYLMLDTSTNGVYVNDAATPIGRRSSYALRHGDILRFGSYQISVTIDIEGTGAMEAPEASAIIPLMTQPLTNTDRTRPDIGASLQLQDLLSAGEMGSPVASGATTTAASAINGSGRSLVEDPAILAFDSGQRSIPPTATASIPRQKRVTDRAVEHLGAIDAFCRGAGIDPKGMTADSPPRVLYLAGVLLREALLGLKGLTLLQREAREQLHIDAGKEDLQHIALTGLPVEDLLLRLLLGHDRHELDAVQWVRETLSGARRHDAATIAALLGALSEFIARLEPHALVQGSEGSAKAMAARFRSLTEAAPGTLPHLFAESFARAFVASYSSNSGNT
jgi:type VI secretion system protein